MYNVEIHTQNHIRGSQNDNDRREPRARISREETGWDGEKEIVRQMRLVAMLRPKLDGEVCAARERWRELEGEYGSGEGR